MIRKTIIRPAAQAEIDQQADYLAEHAGDAVAERFLSGVHETVTMLVEFPAASGLWISDHPRLQDIRKRCVIGFPNHVLFYRQIDDAVEIIHLYHARQDIEARLGDDAGDAP